MAKKTPAEEGGLIKGEPVCCRVVSLVSVDERGQMILPKEIRDMARILPGDKLAITAWGKTGEICCLILVKAEELADMVKDRLGPVMAGFAKK